jgi:hypothetical protein
MVNGTEQAVTVLKDEVLGIEREYVEVKRAAAVGERIKIVSVTEWDQYDKGDVFMVDRIDNDEGFVGFVESDAAASVRNPEGYITPPEYVVLEPSDIVRINGNRYCLLDREAAEGDLVIVTKVSAGYAFFTVGDIGRVIDNKYGGVHVNFNGQGNSRVYEYGEWHVGMLNGNSACAVLEPVAPANTLTPPAAESDIALLQRQVGDILARVTKLELDVKVAREDIALVEEGVTADIERLKPKPAPDSRDKIVARAKADVEKLSTARTRNVPVNGSATKAVFNLGPGQDYVDFVVDRVKRTVVALLRTARGNTVWARGIAKAAPGDCFNVHIGKAIALRRALALPIQADYVNAPQPTEPRVGDVVTSNDEAHATATASYVPIATTTLIKRAPECDNRFIHGVECGLAWRHTHDSGWIGDKQFRIIDDSRDGAEAEVSPKSTGFKPGDRVRITGNNGVNGNGGGTVCHGYKKGDIGVVKAVSSSGNYEVHSEERAYYYQYVSPQNVEAA